MALFFAIFPEGEALQQLIELQSELSAKVDASHLKWEPSFKFHLTLKYLGNGDSPGEREERAILAAEQVQTQFAPFEISFGEIGAFPDEKKPEVLWVGVNNGFPVLVQFAESLDRSLNLEGFERETREYRPHLTLAKAKSRAATASLSNIFNRKSDLPKSVDKMCCYMVSSFSLVRSEFSARGSSYKIVKEFQFSR